VQGTPGGRTRSVRRPFWLDPLSVRASFCVVALAIAAPEEPSACPPQQRQKAMLQPTLSFGRRPVRPRLCAQLPLVYRSVRTVRTHDRPARHCVKARPSHRRSIACAALLSFAGASRRAQHIVRRCATCPSAGLHSHAPSTHAQTRRGTVRGHVCEWVCEQDPQARARQEQGDHDAAPQLARREEEARQRRVEDEERASLAPVAPIRQVCAHCRRHSCTHTRAHAVHPARTHTRTLSLPRSATHKWTVADELRAAQPHAARCCARTAGECSGWPRCLR
jgi:hypothetical protein